MESGVTPQMREVLQKFPLIDGLEAKVRELESVNAKLTSDLTEVVGKQEKMAGMESAAERAAQGWVGANLVWVLMAAFLVMLMQAGFVLFESGCTRAKNVAHTMSMNLLDYVIGMLAFWAFGFAIMFGSAGGNESLGIAEGVLDSGFAIGD